MNGPGSTTEDLRAGGQVRKPVAEFWYAIQPQDDDIIRFSEIYVDPYAVGDRPGSFGKWPWARF